MNRHADQAIAGSSGARRWYRKPGGSWSSGRLGFAQGHGLTAPESPLFTVASGRASRSNRGGIGHPGIEVHIAFPQLQVKA